MCQPLRELGRGVNDLLCNPQPGSFKSKKYLINSPSIISSADVKMSNWTAADIQEMQCLLCLCSCLFVLACCCVGKLRTVGTFKLKAPR